MYGKGKGSLLLMLGLWNKTRYARKEQKVSGCRHLFFNT